MKQKALKFLHIQRNVLFYVSTHQINQNTLT